MLDVEVNMEMYMKWRVGLRIGGNFIKHAGVHVRIGGPVGGLVDSGGDEN